MYGSLVGSLYVRESSAIREALKKHTPYDRVAEAQGAFHHSPRDAMQKNSGLLLETL